MKQLHPRAIWLIFITTGLRLVVPLLFLGVWLSAILSAFVDSPYAFIYILVIVIVLAYLWSRLSYHYYRYELTEASFNKEMGVIWKKYVSIPYERIQNVDIYRGVWARILGLSDVNIQTAGASAQFSRRVGLRFGAEGRLPGLSHEDAVKLRDELIKRAKDSTRKGL